VRSAAALREFRSVKPLSLDRAYKGRLAGDMQWQALEDAKTKIAPNRSHKPSNSRKRLFSIPCSGEPNAMERLLWTSMALRSHSDKAGDVVASTVMQYGKVSDIFRSNAQSTECRQRRMDNLGCQYHSVSASRFCGI
jgi:hypothetical protein